MPRDMYNERLRASKPDLFAWEKQIADGVTIVFPRPMNNVSGENDKKDDKKDVHKDNSTELTERQKVIFSFVQKNVHITRIEMSTKLQVNEKTIRRDLDVLQSKGFIRRVGSRKTGHWEVVK